MAYTQYDRTPNRDHGGSSAPSLGQTNTAIRLRPAGGDENCLAEGSATGTCLPKTSNSNILSGGCVSGTGFGTSTWRKGDKDTTPQFGAWTQETSEKSSNFREAFNLVLRVEEMVEQGEIAEGSKLFIFPDNFVSERAFYNGSSRSKLLHKLVLRLRLMEMEGELFVWVIWFAGTHMIEQGTDGLSRGDLTGGGGGVMVGNDFLRYIPLNKTGIERQAGLKESIEGGLPGHGWRWLKTADWFDQVFEGNDGRFVWTPSPALADVAP